MVLTVSVFLAAIVAVRNNFPMWICCDTYSGLVRLSADVTFQLVQRDYGHSLIQFPQASCTPQFITILMDEVPYLGCAEHVQ
jgi:hypothetical protein